MKLVNATNAALDQIEVEPGIGSPVLGKILDIPGLRTWRVTSFHCLGSTSSETTTSMSSGCLVNDRTSQPSLPKTLDRRRLQRAVRAGAASGNVGVVDVNSWNAMVS